VNVEKLKVPAGAFLIDARDMVYVICPRGHVDQTKKPGFGLTVEQASEAVFYQLCRICYHEFFVKTFPGKALPLTTFEEAQNQAAAWKASTEAEMEKHLNSAAPHWRPGPHGE
jgi:hypothetical protein